MGPEVAWNIGQVPPADGFELGLAVDERVNGFEPIGLGPLAPRAVPTGRSRFWPHAVGIRPVVRSRGDFSDVDWFIKNLEAVEHALDFQYVHLRIIKLQTQHVEINVRTHAVGNVAVGRPSSRAVAIGSACVLGPQAAVVDLPLYRRRTLTSGSAHRAGDLQ